jgi:hypothetical protein
MYHETRLTQPTLPQGTPYGGAAHPFDEILLYNCRGFSTNHPFLCKTNPILSAVGGLQTQYVQRNMKENAIGHLVKTNPIQTQSKPIQKEPK